MATQTKSPTLVTVQAAGVAWTNPSDVLVNNSTGGSVTLGGAAPSSDQLFCNTCGFTLPGGSTLNSINVSLSARGSAAGNLQLVLSDNVGGLISSAVNITITSSSWTTYTSPSGFGGWASPPTVATLDSNGFGVSIIASKSGSSSLVEIDWVTITIDYTPPMGGGIHTSPIIILLS
jgi:hypothetical protein